jgi:sporulation-control protein
MAFLKKMLSKVGIGAARIDARIEKEELIPGESLTGSLVITGGKVEQEINKIDLALVCNYTVEMEKENEDDEGNITTDTVTETRTHSLCKQVVEESFTIQPDEVREIPFSIELPASAPLSVGKTETWLTTNLDIDSALDKQDKDFITVMPTPAQQALFDAMTSLGFILQEADCEGSSRLKSEGLPFVQEFEYVPDSGSFAGRLDEVELVPLVRDDGLEVLMEVDRKARGLSGLLAEVMGRDESTLRFTVQNDELDDLESMISEMIEANA